MSLRGTVTILWAPLWLESIRNEPGAYVPYEPVRLIHQDLRTASRLWGRTSRVWGSIGVPSTMRTDYPHRDEGGNVYTVKDLAKATGLSSRQIYDRISALSPVLDGTLRTGQRGAKLLTDGGFATFRRLVELEAEGMSRGSAVEVIASELSTDEPERMEPIRNDSEPMVKLLERLEQTIEDQRQEIAFLRQQVETLTPLALPKPRRGFLTLFKRRID